MPLGEPVYYVAVTSKMTEWGEQWICIKFCIKLEPSSMETVQMIQKATAMGDWWLAASSGQCTCSCITSCAEFFSKTSNHSGDSAPLQPRFGTLRLLAFPKTTITIEREEISDRRWAWGKYDGAADSNWENCVRSQGAYFEGDWGVSVLCTMFLVSCIFFNKCLYFLYYMAGHLLDRPYRPLTFMIDWFSTKVHWLIWLFCSWRAIRLEDTDEQMHYVSPVGRMPWERCVNRCSAHILQAEAAHRIQALWAATVMCQVVTEVPEKREWIIQEKASLFPL